MMSFAAFLGPPTLAALRNTAPPPLEPLPEQSAPEPDPLLSRAWHLPRIRVPEAWRRTMGAPQTTIAVIDSGINYNHPEIRYNLRRKLSEWPPNGIDDDGNGFIDDVIGWDFVHSNYLPWDRNGHGTFIAGIAAASARNGVGSAGVCPKCSLLPVRFMDAQGYGWDEDGVKALRYAVSERPSVINISFAGEGYDRDYHDVLKEALARDIVVVVAAGNDGQNIDHSNIYPPRFRGLPNMIVVAAVDKFDGLLIDRDSGAGSNWSKNWVHLAAPGSEIIGPWNDGTWEVLDGTSYAAPVVAGAAGLIRTVNPQLSAIEVVQILTRTVRKASPLEEKVISGGVLDVEAALACAATPNLPCLSH